MVGIPAESVTNPLGDVRQIFHQRHSSDGGTGEDFGERAYFETLLEDSAIASQIPALNVDNIHFMPNNSLVRFRGMVQDMFNPEIFVGAFREPGGHWETCKYSDMLHKGPSDAAETKMWERRPYLCVPVPAESAWFKAAAIPPKSSNPVLDAQGVSRDKRTRDGDSDADTSMATAAATDMDGVEGGEEVASSGSKHPRAAADLDIPAKSAVKGLQLSVPEDNALPCLVHVYDSSARIQLNDVVEVLGVISHAPELAQFGFAAGAAAPDGLGLSTVLEDDELAAHPPTSRVPRLHAIVVRSSSGKGSHAIPQPRPAPLQGALVAQARQHALRIISSVLGNDSLAAEFVLLHLLSRVISRQGDVLVGSLSLNITGWPEGRASKNANISGAVASMLHAFRELTPRAIAVPLTIEELNRRALVPAKDYNTDRLSTAALQLAQGTHCIVDESCMQAGQLQEQGVNNLRALQCIMSDQEVPYDFEYYKLPIKTDMPVLILSSQRSILREAVDIQIPLNATTAVGDPDALEAALAVSDLEMVRSYLMHAKQIDFEFKEEMTNVVEAAIKSHKKSDPNGDTRMFHQWMTMARLMSGSLGETTMSRDTWDAVMRMEHARQERLRVV